MSSKLEQALMRLDKVVQALEKAPPPSTTSSGDDTVKAEIHAIRSLVDDAISLLGQHDGQAKGGSS